MSTRALTISVVPHDGLTHEELWRMLHVSWNAVQRAANAALREYFVGDPAVMVTNAKGKATLPKPDAAVARNAYRAACETSPELPTTSVSDICQRVRAKYLHDRWASRVSMKQSGMTFRRPLPLSIRAANWRFVDVGHDEKGRKRYGAIFPLLEMRGTARPTVQFVVRTARDAALLEKIESGEWSQRTLEILPPGWIRKGMIRVKIVYERTVPEKSQAAGVLNVRTAADALLIAHDGEQVWRWNYDSLREKVIAYELRRHRRSEDAKHERRVPASRRRVWVEDGGCEAEKHRNRVRTTLLNIARQVVNRAKRSGKGGVLLDSTIRTWVDPFPWHELAEKIKQCCELEGMSFEEVISNETSESNGHCKAELAGERPSAVTAAEKSSAGNGRKKPVRTRGAPIFSDARNE